jgi:hypothetical protein
MEENTMKTIKTINGVKTLDVTCDLFIIPNPASPYADNDGFYKNRIDKVYEDNGITANADDAIIQIWLVETGDQIDDHGNSDNIIRHGMAILNEDRTKEYIQPRCELVPAKLFEGHKEDDVVEFKYHYNEDDLDVMITFHGTLAQTKYRYRNSGTFEEVLKHVCKI